MHEEIWNRCLKFIKDNLPDVNYVTWFEPIVPLKIKGEVLTIQVPSAFFYEYLEEHFIDLLRTAIRKEIGKEAKLEYSVIMDNNPQQSPRPSIQCPSNNNARKIPGQSVNMPMDKKNGESGIKNPFVIPGLQKIDIDPQLNAKHSFEHYIEGECNRLARSAGLAVAENPGGTAFNPLFIFGGSGLGKTHIIQAIGIKTKELFPDKIVLYVDANKFKTQFIQSTLNNTSTDFLHFYQMIDMLIIDDVQELAGQTKTQNAFFHIFNHLQQSGKQLILSSDKPPVELQGLEQRLLSRFKWGLSAEISIPDYQTRVDILRQKTYHDGIVLSDEIIDYIATHITSNVRDLEAALICLLAQSTFNKKDITLDLAKNMIDKVIKNTRKNISIDYIQKVVCGYFNVPIDLVHSKTRKREIVQARQVSMFFSKHLTKSSLSSIGAQIGGKDHATVLHACKTIANLMETDKKFKVQIDDIEKKLKF